MPISASVFHAVGAALRYPWVAAFRRNPSESVLPWIKKKVSILHAMSLPDVLASTVCDTDISGHIDIQAVLCFVCSF